MPLALVMEMIPLKRAEPIPAMMRGRRPGPPIRVEALRQRTPERIAEDQVESAATGAAAQQPRRQEALPLARARVRQEKDRKGREQPPRLRQMRVGTEATGQRQGIQTTPTPRILAVALARVPVARLVVVAVPQVPVVRLVVAAVPQVPVVRLVVAAVPRAPVARLVVAAVRRVPVVRLVVAALRRVPVARRAVAAVPAPQFRVRGELQQRLLAPSLAARSDRRGLLDWARPQAPQWAERYSGRWQRRRSKKLDPARRSKSLRPTNRRNRNRPRAGLRRLPRNRRPRRQGLQRRRSLLRLCPHGQTCLKRRNLTRGQQRREPRRAAQTG